MFRRNCQNAGKFHWMKSSRYRSDFRIDVVCVDFWHLTCTFVYISSSWCRFRTFTSLPLLLLAFLSSCTLHSSIIALDLYENGQPRSISLHSSKIICKQPRRSESMWNHYQLCAYWSVISNVSFFKTSIDQFREQRRFFPGFLQSKIVDL
jgi:hypothetical protein